MASQLQVSETIAERTVETEVVRNIGIPSSLPPAERVVSVNARLEITESEARAGNVVFSGIIRSSVYYAPVGEESNVVSIRRNFSFTESVSVPGARSGFEVNVDGIISDIDFYLINDRLIGVEYIVTSDIEITVPEQIDFIEERENIEIVREEIRVRRRLREREFSRDFNSVERLRSNKPDISRVINVDSDIQIGDVETGENVVQVSGVIRNNILYLTTNEKVEYIQIKFPFENNFVIRGVKAGMSPFVEAAVISSVANRVDDRRIRINVDSIFKILVLTEELVSVPTDITSSDQIFPVRKSVIVERVVAEERTRILARGTTEIEENSPDIERIIRATGRLKGPLIADAERGGVSIDGIVDTNIIYVADLPNQPVYFTASSIPFAYFIDIDEVSQGMNVVVEGEVIKTTAQRIDQRRIRVRATVEVNLIVTERVRVSVVTGISERPVSERPTTPTRPGDGDIRYTVRSGDTLYLIAERYGVSLNSLIRANNISDSSNIRVGQQIIIPQ